MKKKEKGWVSDKVFSLIFKGLFNVLASPYYFVKWLFKKKVEAENEKIERDINKKRDVKAIYEKFKVVKKVKGRFDNWLIGIESSDSQIGIILGARGSGKTAFGVKFLENFKIKATKNCYAMGFDRKEMPLWINVVDKIEEIKNNSVVLIDEGGILFNSRNSFSNANKLLSSLILIARHKDLSILFISQNSSNLDVNILRQADFLVFKRSSLLQKEFERKIIQKIYKEIEDDFGKFVGKDVTYIYSDSFKGFVSVPLPSFWKKEISKSFRS